MATKLSNVIGSPFKESVLRQLSIRARRNSTVNRSNDEILYLANKTAWVRLTSSVNIVTPPTQDILAGVGALEGFGNYLFYQALGLNPVDYPSPDSLAKKWILEAGTSIQNGNGVTLRQGIGPNGAYGLGGTEELGYRPMPGLTSVAIETTGRLGSLKQATINFTVWNMNQLNVIEALYFRLGYSMLLEWGHTQYFTNKNSNGTVIPDGVFVNQDIYGIDDPFSSNARKETIQQAIARKGISTSNNYDGMLGIVSNFTWTFNQEGGYDCVVRLIGLGAVMDSMRINTLYTLPPELVRKYDQAADILEAARRAEIASQQPVPPLPEETGVNFPSTPKTEGELYEVFRRFNKVETGALEFLVNNDVYGVADYSTNRLSDSNYFIEFKKGTESTTLSDATIDQANSRYGGLWITNGNNFFRLDRFLPTQATLDIRALDLFASEYLRVDLTKRRNFYAQTNRVVYQNPFIALFDFNIKNPDPIQGTSGDGTPVIIEVSPLQNNKGVSNISYEMFFPYPAGFDENLYFDLEVNTEGEENYPVTADIVISAFAEWVQAGAPVTIESVSDPNSRRLIEIKGFFERSVLVPNKNANSGERPQQKTIRFTFETNNPQFILNSGGPVVAGIPEGNIAEEANTGDADGLLNEADVAQTTASDGLQSALTAMLAIILTTSQEKALNNTKTVIEIDITEQTKQFYQAGILGKIFNTLPEINLQNRSFDITQYALRGFNSELMIQPDLEPQISKVNFQDLFKAYLVRYPKILPDGTFNSVSLPVYIKLGYLLAFLNNMCLFYDSKVRSTGVSQTTDTDPRPYVYIDFNPETNFCLTLPQQLSVDPSICLIPFEGTTADYKELFPPEISTDGFFNPQKNNVITFELTKTGYTFNV
jgi:hypothetical protein